MRRLVSDMSGCCEGQSCEKVGVDVGREWAGNGQGVGSERR